MRIEKAGGEVKNGRVGGFLAVSRCVEQTRSWIVIPRVFCDVRSFCSSGARVLATCLCMLTRVVDNRSLVGVFIFQSIGRH